MFLDRINPTTVYSLPANRLQEDRRVAGFRRTAKVKFTVRERVGLALASVLIWVCSATGFFSASETDN